ncbi:GNAT family N-acetyltransferase [Adhaeribacter soli]|uniref:GNAT family N-acetyltransferase n=1 Tax=Adhaeribacter soli TaxID=2607655 RepID=A0A5N1IX10_9BACT|nr:GNAT family N-acetyltransferase [Adhaeribacter soli]KAA9338824.1 GNAT family N-acetyltransferase [Adhaeribacter soli]
MIRPYIPEDKPALLAILKQNTPRYFHPSEANDYEAYLEKHREDYFVAEENGKVVGAGGINYFPAEKLARLSWDIIDPDYQGKGIGKELTRFRINVIKSNSAINQIVVRTTQLTYRFYEKMGFRLERTEKDFWAEGFDLYQMHLNLPDSTIA